MPKDSSAADRTSGDSSPRGLQGFTKLLSITLCPAPACDTAGTHQASPATFRAGETAQSILLFKRQLLDLLGYTLREVRWNEQVDGEAKPFLLTQCRYLKPGARNKKAHLSPCCCQAIFWSESLCSFSIRGARPGAQRYRYLLTLEA